MKKRAIVALGVVAAILLTGCADTSVKNDIIVVSDVKMEERTEESVSKETEIEEITIEEMEQAVPMAASTEDLSPILGTWNLDGLKTDQEMEKTGTDWMYEYGSGGKYGAGATLREDGYFSYYVAIGIGGEGSYVYEDGTVTATVIPYERITEEQTIELYPKSEDGQYYLVLKMDNHEIYLVREEG
ncbi:MAG: hypothetical protein IJ326_09475 [Lachnospiraceae bacterium]|nr:hypothetical protein [Lachnospiraceae bacterium]